MGHLNATSLDIVGIEIGRGLIRAVALDQDRCLVTASTEVVVRGSGCDEQGVVDPPRIVEALRVALPALGEVGPDRPRVGFSIGPCRSGVGSGPTMDRWLTNQAEARREPLVRAGDLGVAFAPRRAVGAVVSVARALNLDLVRVDLAPVAVARAIGEQVDETICVGSGCGWHARMRDFEVLEAMETDVVEADEPASLMDPRGRSRPIDRYGWIEVAPELTEHGGFDLGRMAAAVGAAVGVAYEGQANLLQGATVECRVGAGVGSGVAVPAHRQIRPESAVVGDRPAGRALRSGSPDEQTVRLASMAGATGSCRSDIGVPPPRPRLRVLEGGEGQSVNGGEPSGRTRRAAAGVPSPEPAAVRRPATGAVARVPAPSHHAALPVPVGAAQTALEVPAVLAGPSKDRGAGYEAGGPAALASIGGAALALPAPAPTPAPSLGHVADVAKPAFGGGRSSAAPRHAGGTGNAAGGSRVSSGHWDAGWDDERVDATDPINLFSPEVDPAVVRTTLDRRFEGSHLLVVLGLLAVVALLVYLVVL